MWTSVNTPRGIEIVAGCEEVTNLFLIGGGWVRVVSTQSRANVRPTNSVGACTAVT